MFDFLLTYHSTVRRRRIYREVTISIEVIIVTIYAVMINVT